MRTVTMHKAKSTLSQLVAEPTRKFGALAGQVAVSPAFFEPLPTSD